MHSKGTKYDMGMHRDGSWNKSNVILFVIYSVNQVFQLTMIQGTIYLCVLAQVNAGLITSMWAITPFFSATLDAIFFHQHINRSQIFGMMFVVVSVILLGLKDFLSSQP